VPHANTVPRVAQSWSSAAWLLRRRSPGVRERGVVHVQAEMTGAFIVTATFFFEERRVLRSVVAVFELPPSAVHVARMLASRSEKERPGKMYVW